MRLFIRGFKDFWEAVWPVSSLEDAIEFLGFTCGLVSFMIVIAGIVAAAIWFISKP